MSLPSSSPSESLENAYLERLREEYGFLIAESTLDTSLSPNPAKEIESHALEEAEGGYEFRLFSDPVAGDTIGNKNKIKRIEIRSPSPVHRDPGFVTSQRPFEYYFTGQLDESRKEEFSASALSGEEVLRGRNTKWPGCYLPWRVSIIKQNASNGDFKVKKDLDTVAHTFRSNGKKRSGKKRRIAIRMKLQAAECSQEERLTAEREKKKRINRGKKVRRKMKEKAAKLVKEGSEAQEQS